MSIIKEIITDHIQHRSQIFKLAIADLKKTYSGSVLGWSWAVIRPAILIFVFWFAFSFGLRKGGDVNGYPFFLWLISGMIPWYYMRDMITGGAGSIRRYKYLVTKIKYPVSTIPTFVNLALTGAHIGLVVLMIVIFMGFGYMPTVYYLQIPFYMLLMLMFFNAWGLFAGVLSTVSRDFYNLVKSLVTALFWMSGILYDANTIDNDIIRKVLLFNPATIAANGYRDIFINHVWFWENWSPVINFLIVYAVMQILAFWAYKKLKKDIPDIL